MRLRHNAKLRRAQRGKEITEMYELPEDHTKDCECSASCLGDLLSDPTLIYAEAVKKWGHNLQFDMLVEECAELIAAMNRLKRGRSDLVPLLEEIADVEIMLGQMRVIFDPELIETVKRKKLTRLAERTGQYHAVYG